MKHSKSKVSGVFIDPVLENKPLIDIKNISWQMIC